MGKCKDKGKKRQLEDSEDETGNKRGREESGEEDDQQFQMSRNMLREMMNEFKQTVTEEILARIDIVRNEPGTNVPITNSSSANMSEDSQNAFQSSSLEQHDQNIQNITYVTKTTEPKKQLYYYAGNDSFVPIPPPASDGQLRLQNNVSHYDHVFGITDSYPAPISSIKPIFSTAGKVTADMLSAGLYSAWNLPVPSTSKDTNCNSLQYDPTSAIPTTDPKPLIPPTSKTLQANWNIPNVSVAKLLCSNGSLTNVSASQANSGFSGFTHHNLPQANTYIPGSIVPNALNTDDIFVPTSTVETLNTAILKLLGKKENTFSLPATTLNRGISDQLRLKIWNNKYINFLDLVSRSDAPYDDKDYNERPQKGAKINSHHLWAKAFAIYHSVYIQRFPELSSALCQYGEFIRELSFRAPNTYIWRLYDEIFRFERQGDLKPWDQMDTPLWIRLTTLRNLSNVKPASPVTTYANQNQNKGKNFQKNSSYNQNKNGKSNWIYEKCISNNICFRFSHLNNCKFTSCKFKHICYHCFGKHTGKSCSSGSQSQKPKTSESQN